VKLKSRLQILLLLVAAFIVLILPSLADLYTDWLWFGEVGYRQVMATSLTTEVGLGLLVFGGVFLALFGNMRLALQFLVEPYLVVGTIAGNGSPIVIGRRPLVRMAIGVAALVAALVGMWAAGHWLEWLWFRHATWFGTGDPILGHDVGFYVFRLPFLEFLRTLLLLTVVLSLAGSGVVYILAWMAGLDRRGNLALDRRARTHLSLLGAAWLVLLAFSAYLNIPRLLTTPSGIIDGASFTDVAARIPALWALVGASFVAAGLAVWHAFSSRLWPLFGAIGLYLLVSAGGAAYATAVQRIVVVPNEQVKETPFIVHNIAATRKAFGLEQVEERQLSGDAQLTRQDITRNAETIENVRLWDHQPLLDTFGQIQEIRTYYDFVSVDNDRYIINGRYRQVMLSARELNSEALPNRSWINEQLTFTHGYGLTLGPVNEVTNEGLPVLFIKNLPPESSVGLDVSQPSIYFGELASDYVFVRTRAKEFHYPKGDDNVYTTYDGQAGVSVSGFWRKLLFSGRFRTFKIVLSNDLTPESRVLFHRRILDRVSTIAPFLTYDRDPYLVISGGRLFWMLDAYTVSSRYPYSRRAPNGFNYIRNSVKVVVDAYNGTTRFYLADPQDPVAQTVAKIFPGLLRPIREMPEDLRRHIRYPEDLFAVQAAMFSTYHMTNPAVFYNKEDQWEIPSIESGTASTPMQPYYTVMRLPGESSAEFIQMLPFTPRRKDNLAAWMVARSDGKHYGSLVAFQFPKQKVVYGPRQIIARINQDQAISPQITLWNQQGSEVNQGTLLVIPIEESLLYVRPLYLRSAGGKIPELKRVIVAYQSQIVMENTLDAALDRIFGRGVAERLQPSALPAAVEFEPAFAESPADLIALAREHYQRAMQALRDADWALYGEEIKALGEVLDKLAGQSEPPKNAPTRPVPR
jgi:uncharacterized membrane protein (UPF0182 family)